MAFPRKLLAPGEEIVLDSYPHWSLLVPRIAFALLIDAGCIAIAIAWSSAPLYVGWILLGIGLLPLLAVAAKVITWRATQLVITTRRVVYRTGVVHRIGREIPITRIQDVTYRQTLLERMLGAGSLTVESAGEGGQEPFPDIRRPAQVQSLINQLVMGPSPWDPGHDAAPEPPEGRRGRDRGRDRDREHDQPMPPPAVDTRFVRSEPPTSPVPASAAPPTPPPVPPPSADAGEARPQSHTEQLQHLEELHRLGVLTDAEYEQHRRQVLDLP